MGGGGGGGGLNFYSCLKKHEKHLLRSILPSGGCIPGKYYCPVELVFKEDELRQNSWEFQSPNS